MKRKRSVDQVYFRRDKVFSLQTLAFIGNRYLGVVNVERVVGGPGPNFIIKDLPPVLILIIADQSLKDSLCCSNKYN